MTSVAKFKQHNYSYKPIYLLSSFLDSWKNVEDFMHSPYTYLVRPVV